MCGAESPEVLAKREKPMDQGYANEDIIDEMRRNPKPWINFLLIAANILVFAAVELTGSSLDTAHMIRWGAAWTPLIREGQYYRLFSSMFLHFGAEHLINNMLLLFFAGYYLEQYAGRLRYLLIYLGGGLAGSLCSYGLEVYRGEAVVSAGASGAVFGVLGALTALVLLNRGRLGALTGRRLLLMIVFSIYVGLRAEGVDNAAHIGGLLGGAALALLLLGFRFRKWGNEG